MRHKLLNNVVGTVGPPAVVEGQDDEAQPLDVALQRLLHSLKVPAAAGRGGGSEVHGLGRGIPLVGQQMVRQGGTPRHTPVNDLKEEGALTARHRGGPKTDFCGCHNVMRKEVLSLYNNVPTNRGGASGTSMDMPPLTGPPASRLFFANAAAENRQEEGV